MSSSNILSSTTICLVALLLLSVVQHATAESMVDKARATGQFGILDAAIQTYDIQGMIASLSGIKVTIFGPTDAALTAAGITDGTQLAEATLLRHALIGEDYTANLKTIECQEKKALDQTTLVIKTASDGSITVNGVSLNTAYADIAGDEGVFHGIDGVIPTTYPGCSTTDTPAAAPEAGSDSAASISVSSMQSLLIVVVVAVTSSMLLSLVL